MKQGQYYLAQLGGTFLDSPATTSSLTYVLQIKAAGSNAGSGSVYWSNNAATCTMTLMEIAQ